MISPLRYRAPTWPRVQLRALFSNSQSNSPALKASSRATSSRKYLNTTRSKLKVPRRTGSASAQ